MANLEKVVENLLKNGVKINERDEQGRQTMHYAARGGAKEVVQTLIRHSKFVINSPIHSEDNYFTTPLQLAARHGHAEVIKVLFRKKAEVKLHNVKRLGALRNIKMSDFEEVTKLLLEDAAEINAQALQIATSQGNLATVTSLLVEGADVNAQGMDGTALALAAQHGYKDIVKMLLEGGANFDGGRKYGIALTGAAQKDHTDVVEILLGAKANVNRFLKTICSAAQHSRMRILYLVKVVLRVAAKLGRLDVVEKILAFEIVGDEALRSNSKSDRAVKSLNPLIDEQISTMRVSACWDGQIALQAAVRGGHLEVVDKLIYVGANVNAAASYLGKTALQAAARGGHLEVVKKLVSAGADVNAPASRFGQTALQAAAEGGHLEVVKALEQTLAQKHG